MENNYHGIPGAGDCDCFTIAATACFIVAGLPCEIVLAGNKVNDPTHVYNTVKWGNHWVVFDLTNNQIGEERPYRYKKYLQIKTY